jgi:hypothetical protein
MTDNKWYQFSGFMQECIYQLDHPECPFHKFRYKDQYERLEQLISISDRQAETIVNKCRTFQCECKPILYPNKKINRTDTSVEAQLA